MTQKIDEIKLSELAVGKTAEVVDVENENLALKRRLLDMGITCGVTVKIKKIAPLGDPISIELRGYELCLRKTDMKNIKVKVIKWELL